MATNNYLIALTFDPTSTVNYGTSSNLITGLATVTMNPAFGISSLSIDVIQLSGATTHFAAVSTNKAIPGTFVNGGSFVFTTKYNNNYIHLEPVLETVVAMASTSTAQLSAGAIGTVLANSFWLSTTGTVNAKANYQGFNGKKAFLVQHDDEGNV